MVECIGNLRMKRHARIGADTLRSSATTVSFANKKKIQGDRIVVVVQKSRSIADSGSGASQSVAAANRVRRGDVRQAIVVRTAKQVQRKDGMTVRFGDNACALVGKNGEPLGTRINGVVGAELRNKQQSKILSLASMHV